MKEYFQVAINQQIERAESLLETIIDDSEVPQEFYILAKNCRSEIVRAKQKLEELRSKPEFQHPDLQTVRLREFRREVDRISKLEATGIAALSRRNQDDIFLTRLVELIRREIRYPFLPPTVTGLSTNYFYIHNDIQLMFVPLSEGNYLLHLPDLYHELAHPLLFDADSPRVRVLRQSAELAWAHAATHLDLERAFEERRKGPEEYQVYFSIWQRSWWNWVVEFFCDLFGIFTLGPAYAWAHIHLCMKNEHNPFAVPTRIQSSHPADDARMRVMLFGLEKIGFQEAVTELQGRWNQYLEIADVKTNSNYKRCFPESLLQQVVDLAHKGITETSCRMVTDGINDPIHRALNDAWYQFWHYPQTYIEWEKQTVNQLRNLCRMQVTESIKE